MQHFFSLFKTIELKLNDITSLSLFLAEKAHFIEITLITYQEYHDLKHLLLIVIKIF